MIDRNKLKKIKNILLNGWYDDDFMRGLWHSGCFTTILCILIGLVVFIRLNWV